MTVGVALDLPPLFRCTGDTDALLGHHDGVSSWTLNVAADPAASRQMFVSHHERAHHQLHSGTPWGMAMLVAGLADGSGEVAAAAWRSLAEACTQTHEAYATFAAVALTDDGLDALAGNLPYLQHLRRARAVAVPFDDRVVDTAFHLIMHLLMAPGALLELDADDLRQTTAVDVLVRDHAPDRRFARLRAALTDRNVVSRLNALIPGDPEAVVDMGAVAAMLGDLGITTPPQIATNTWTIDMIAALSPLHPDLSRRDSGQYRQAHSPT